MLSTTTRPACLRSIAGHGRTDRVDGSPAVGVGGLTRGMIPPSRGPTAPRSPTVRALGSCGRKTLLRSRESRWWTARARTKALARCRSCCAARSTGPRPPLRSRRCSSSAATASPSRAASRTIHICSRRPSRPTAARGSTCWCAAAPSIASASTPCARSCSRIGCRSGARSRSRRHAPTRCSSASIKACAAWSPTCRCRPRARRPSRPRRHRCDARH